LVLLFKFDSSELVRSTVLKPANPHFFEKKWIKKLSFWAILLIPDTETKFEVLLLLFFQEKKGFKRF